MEGLGGIAKIANDMGSNLSPAARQAIEGENTIGEIRRFFETNAKPLGSNEFIVFWKSLSEEEKLEFKKADLS